MTDREGIIRLATEYMGWTVVSTDDRKVFAVRSGEDEPPSRVCLWIRAGLRTFLQMWNPFESHADAHELEAAIPQAKRDAYAVILYGLVTQTKEPWSQSNAEDWFRLAHATPRQRSQAALAVLEQG